MHNDMHKHSHNYNTHNIIFLYTLDLQKILHEEKCSDSNEGWKFVTRSKYSEVWRKSDASKPVHLIKVMIIIIQYNLKTFWVLVDY